MTNLSFYKIPITDNPSSFLEVSGLPLTIAFAYHGDTNKINIFLSAAYEYRYDTKNLRAIYKPAPILYGTLVSARRPHYSKLVKHRDRRYKFSAITAFEKYCDETNFIHNLIEYVIVRPEDAMTNTKPADIVPYIPRHFGMVAYDPDYTAKPLLHKPRAAELIYRIMHVHAAINPRLQPKAGQDPIYYKNVNNRGERVFAFLTPAVKRDTENMYIKSSIPIITRDEYGIECPPSAIKHGDYRPDMPYFYKFHTNNLLQMERQYLHNLENYVEAL